MYFKNKKNGGLYKVTGLSTDRTNSSEGRPMVEYTCREGMRHVRCLEEFKEKFERAKLVLGIDFDGTICGFAFPGCGAPLPLAIETIKELHDAGHRLVLNTCRDGKTLLDAREYLRERGVYECFEAVNENLPDRIDGFLDSRKLWVDFYIGDDTLWWNGWADVRERLGLESNWGILCG